MHGHFHTSYGTQCSMDEVVAEIIRFTDADPRRKYKLIIGSDSLLVSKNGKSQNGMADFVTAIVIHRVGNGGRYFWRRAEYQLTPSLRHRIYQEVLYSLEIAHELMAYFKTMPANLDFEIHVDVGDRGETKVMIQELTSMIRAHNFMAKTKPESYAATKVADRHV